MLDQVGCASGNVFKKVFKRQKSGNIKVFYVVSSTDSTVYHIRKHTQTPCVRGNSWSQCAVASTSSET